MRHLLSPDSIASDASPESLVGIWLALTSGAVTAANNASADDAAPIAPPPSDSDLVAAVIAAREAWPDSRLIADPVRVATTLATLRVDRDTLMAALLVVPILAGPSHAETIESIGTPRARDLARNVAELLRRRFDSATDAARHTQPDGGRATDRDTETRTERLRRMLLSMVDDTRAIPIKIAYRLQHLRDALETQTAIDRARRAPSGADSATEPDALEQTETQESCALERLAQETLDVISPLANRLGLGSLKWELEDLAFRILEPQAYRDIARSLDANRSEREAYVGDFVARLDRVLKDEGVSARVFGRPKHLYSIWRKMQRKKRPIDTLFDLRATRVIVADLNACYTALGVIHDHFRHLPSEFDDYIANPKPNGYQSIHTAVIGPGGKVVEVQVRTEAMDDFAELGVAAHWAYKEGGREDRALQASINALRHVLEGDVDDHQIVEHLQTGALHQRVFVLTPAGDVLDLIRGATPLDFAYTVHTELGHRCRGAKVDGRIVPLTYRLRSGERVEILAGSEARPSRDWMNPNLGYLASARARHKVRAWFRQQDQDHHLADGREILDRERHRLGLGHLSHDELAKLTGQPDSRSLAIALGSGDLTVAQLIGRLTPPKPQRRGPPSHARQDTATSITSEIRIRGVGGLKTDIAPCCEPQPGDSIVGYITRGAGVRIHRADCVNILHLTDEQRRRLIQVSWGDDPQRLEAHIEVLAHDRPGLLRDIADILVRAGLNMIDVHSHTDAVDRSVRMKIVAEYEGLEQLARVLDRLEALPHVETARRLNSDETNSDKTASQH
ncbi:MAG: RelA/SpoT family protein [Thioalkalivibrionaceae bacterium]